MNWNVVLFALGIALVVLATGLHAFYLNLEMQGRKPHAKYWAMGLVWLILGLLIIGKTTG